MELTNSQTEVVSELTSYAISSLESNTVDYQIFKAPTGSGKTFMILNLSIILLSDQKITLKKN
ncbi:hypothetical protein ACXYRQ_04040 [Mycoplasma sp. 394]